jgi:hypothetical protein
LIRKAQPENVGASDELTERFEELQVTNGEGPVVDALTGGAPVLISDLGADAEGRWPVTGAALAATEMRAVFVFPMQVGAIRLGALSLYRLTPGELSPMALADALRVVDVVSMLLLGRDGDLADDFSEEWLEDSSFTTEIHQATGIVISQLAVSAEEAFVRLRAHAFAQDLPLSEVARSVVAGTLRLDGDRG